MVLSLNHGSRKYIASWELKDYLMNLESSFLKIVYHFLCLQMKFSQSETCWHYFSHFISKFNCYLEISYSQEKYLEYPRWKFAWVCESKDPRLSDSIPIPIWNESALLILQCLYFCYFTQFPPTLWGTSLSVPLLLPMSSLPGEIYLQLFCDHYFN